MCICLKSFTRFAFFLVGPMALFMDQSTCEKRVNSVLLIKNYFATIFSAITFQFSIFNKINNIRTKPKFEEMSTSLKWCGIRHFWNLVCRKWLDKFDMFKFIVCPWGLPTDKDIWTYGSNLFFPCSWFILILTLLKSWIFLLRFKGTNHVFMTRNACANETIL